MLQKMISSIQVQKAVYNAANERYLITMYCSPGQNPERLVAVWADACESFVAQSYDPFYVALGFAAAAAGNATAESLTTHLFFEPSFYGAYAFVRDAMRRLEPVGEMAHDFHDAPPPITHVDDCTVGDAVRIMEYLDKRF